MARSDAGASARSGQHGGQRAPGRRTRVGNKAHRPPVPGPGDRGHPPPDHDHHALHPGVDEIPAMRGQLPAGHRPRRQRPAGRPAGQRPPTRHPRPVPRLSAAMRSVDDAQSRSCGGRSYRRARRRRSRRGGRGGGGGRGGRRARLRRRKQRSRVRRPSIPSRHRADHGANDHHRPQRRAKKGPRPPIRPPSHKAKIPAGQGDALRPTQAQPRRRIA